MDTLASTCIYSYPRKLICCESYRTHSKNTVAEEPLHTKFGVEILISEYATAIVQYCQESQYWANISNAIHSSSRASSWQRNMTLYLRWIGSSRTLCPAAEMILLEYTHRYLLLGDLMISSLTKK